MGHQFTFYLTPNDIVDLNSTLSAIDDLVILSRRSPRPSPMILDSVNFAQNGQREYLFHIVQRATLDFIRMKEVPAQEYWAIDSLSEPVIDLTLRHFEGNELKPGRLYYNDILFDENGRPGKKEASFLSWARGVFSTVKKSLNPDSDLDAYLGDEGLEMRRIGDVKFSGF
ncbi:MAG: hypothetical protein ABI999_17110 [Acidobacteriota bacterium]